MEKRTLRLILVSCLQALVAAQPIIATSQTAIVRPNDISVASQTTISPPGDSTPVIYNAPDGTKITSIENESGVTASGTSKTGSLYSFVATGSGGPNTVSMTFTEYKVGSLVISATAPNTGNISVTDGSRRLKFTTARSLGRYVVTVADSTEKTYSVGLPTEAETITYITKEIAGIFPQYTAVADYFHPVTTHITDEATLMAHNSPDASPSKDRGWQGVVYIIGKGLVIVGTVVVCAGAGAISAGVAAATCGLGAFAAWQAAETPAPSEGGGGDSTGGPPTATGGNGAGENGTKLIDKSNGTTDKKNR
jgi:hypothetical protein